MKKTPAAFLALIFLVLLPGCTLIPSDVEYFQKKVDPVPEYGQAADESLKQAADLAADKARETVDAAQAAQVPLEVMDPALDTRNLADAVSDRIGEPQNPWKGSSQNLITRMDSQEADLDLKLAAYQDNIKDLIGKKIEGSGAIQVGYFTNLILVGALFLMAWIILKALAVANPPLQVGVKAVKMGTRAAQKALVELVEGGQEFKRMLAEEFDEKSAQRIRKFFTDAHLKRQSRDTHEVVKALK